LPVWCRPCQDDIIDALNRLPRRVAELAAMGGRVAAGARTDESVKRAPGSAAPSPSPGWDHIDKTVRVVLAIEDDLRSVTGDPPAGRLRPSSAKYRGDAGTTRDRINALHAATQYMTRYRAALLSQTDAARIGRVITRTDRHLELLTGRDPLTHRLPVPCPSCDYLSLTRRDGDDKIRCGRWACARVWREDQYEWLTHVAVEVMSS